MAYDNIPIIVALWEHPNFSGKRLLLHEDTPNLGLHGFHDVTSAIGIHRGPNFNPTAPNLVTFFEHSDFTGRSITLGPGEYPDILAPDTISSVKFNVGPTSPPTIGYIPLVVELFEHPDYTGRKLIMYENIPNLHTYADFGDVLSSFRMYVGPSLDRVTGVELWSNADYTGQRFHLGSVGPSPSRPPGTPIGHSANFVPHDRVSSAKFVF